jgi:polyketide biosynthesis enoyl-CoA hydratase PksH
METVRFEANNRLCWITLCRPERANSITGKLVEELHACLDAAERMSECCGVVLQAEGGVFCSGLDFAEASRSAGVVNHEGMQISEYMRLLGRMASSSKVFVSLVEGKVIAGGVGLVAASDYVVAGSRAEFSLSEALWGLLPCCVLPYLIRRVGFQKAYVMTLTTRVVPALEALDIHLVDELSEAPFESLRKLLLRLKVLQGETVSELKAYFRKLWMITPDVERLAVQEITRLAEKPAVRENLRRYLERGTFPWEREQS